MVKMSRKIEYALIALKHMLKKDINELTSAKEISNDFNIPFDVISKVLQILNQNKILKSEQGVSGGYKIISELKSVSLYDLIRFIEGPVGLVRCLVKDPSECEIISNCNIIEPLNYLNTKILNLYKSINLEEILYPKKFQAQLEDISL